MTRRTRPTQTEPLTLNALVSELPAAPADPRADDEAPTALSARRRTARRLVAGGLAAGLATTAATLALHAPAPSPSASTVLDGLSAEAATAPSALATPVPTSSRLASRAPRASRSAARTALPPVPTKVVTKVVAVGSSFSGVASWYGGQFQGRRTASGERFDTNDFTAASKTLPFGTKLRVCHRQRCVVVRINDRGPYVGSRILDLSRAAKNVLGYDGVGYVTATPIASKTVTVVDTDALAAQRAATRAAEVKAARARRAAAAHRTAVAKRAAVAKAQADAEAARLAAQDRGPLDDLATLPPVPASTAAGLLLAGSGGVVRLRRRRDGS